MAKMKCSICHNEIENNVIRDDESGYEGIMFITTKGECMECYGEEGSV
jgi:hypothetical protein